MKPSKQQRTWALGMFLLHATKSTAGFIIPKHAISRPTMSIEEERKIDLRSDAARSDRVLLAANFCTEATTKEEMETLPVDPVTSFHFSLEEKAWDQLVPPLKPWEREWGRGGDITVEWNINDDLSDVAWSMLEQLGLTSSQHAIALEDHLTQCMETFQTFCSEHLRVDSPLSSSEQAASIHGFRARIVATRGSLGTKCPRWHVDHVPVRWIQSLVGPGCEFIEGMGDTNNDSDSDPLATLKERLEELNNDNQRGNPSSSHINARQAAEQEIALLAGNRWNEFARSPRHSVPPVLHKSPSIPWWQGRVLLTMDVNVPYQHD